MFSINYNAPYVTTFHSALELKTNYNTIKFHMSNAIYLIIFNSSEYTVDG